MRCFRLFRSSVNRIAAVLMLFAAGSAAYGQWELHRIGTSSVAVFGSDSSGRRIIVEGYGAGVWLSNDYGGLWLPINARLGTQGYLQMNDLQIVDADGDSMLISVSERHGLWSCHLTTDGGLSWTEIHRSRDAVITAWNANPSIWFLCESGRFGRSSDSGQNWQWTDLYIGRPMSLYQDPCLDSVLFIACYYMYYEGISIGGLLRSTDLGETWSAILDLHSVGVDWAVLYDVLRLSDGGLLVPVRSAGRPDWLRGTVLRSDDNGLSWTEADSGLPVGFQPVRVTEDVPVGTLLMIGFGPHGVYRSEDGGTSWHRCRQGLPVNGYRTYCLYRNRFSGEIDVSTAGWGIFKTTDHGLSWSQTAAPPSSDAVDAIRYAGRSVFATDRAFRQWRYDYTSQRWEELTVPLSEDTVVVPEPVVFHNDSVTVVPLLKWPFYSDSQYLQMSYSFDDGYSWSLYPFAPFYTGWWMRAVPCGADVQLVAITSFPVLRVSDNLGHSWVDRFWPCEALDDFGMGDCSNAFAVGSDESGNGRVFRTTNMGESWEDLGYPGPRFIWGPLVQVLDNRAYLLAQAGANTVSECWRWADGEWAHRGTVPDTNNVVSLTAVPLADDSLLVTMTGPGRIWLSRDLGTSWEERTCPLPVPEQNAGVWDLAYDMERQELWAATGLGMASLRLETLLKTDKPQPVNPAEHDVQLSVHPNPFNDRVTLRFYVGTTSRVSLDLYDCLGRLTESLLQQVETPGWHEFDLQARRFASGVYFARLATPKGTVTRRLLLMK
jgi:photosystem II stability/assembly factor-like uncharacterized protein